MQWPLVKATHRAHLFKNHCTWRICCLLFRSWRLRPPSFAARISRFLCWTPLFQLFLPPSVLWLYCWDSSLSLLFVYPVFPAVAVVRPVFESLDSDWLRRRLPPQLCNSRTVLVVQDDVLNQESAHLELTPCYFVHCPRLGNFLKKAEIQNIKLSFFSNIIIIGYQQGGPRKC